MEYEFELPYPPSVNGYWRTYKGSQIISVRGRKYRVAAVIQMHKLKLAGKKIAGRMHVDVVIHPPTKRAYDIDNWCKAPFDALTHAGFWLDDEQVDSMNVTKGELIKGGLIRIKAQVMTS